MPTIGVPELLVLVITALSLTIPLIMVLAVAGWAYNDAVRRGKSPFWIVLLVGTGFPLGLLAWLALRPAPIAPPAQRNPYLPDYLQNWQ